MYMQIRNGPMGFCGTVSSIMQDNGARMAEDNECSVTFGWLRKTFYDDIF